MKSDIPDRTFAFAVGVVKLCKTLNTSRGVPRAMTNQLLRSGTSIGANVEEAQAAQSEADFVSKYSIACKEARETLYWLRLMTASGMIPPDQVADLENECNELISILTSIIKKLRSKHN